MNEIIISSLIYLILVVQLEFSILHIEQNWVCENIRCSISIFKKQQHLIHKYKI
jgi:hypothetical protein